MSIELAKLRLENKKWNIPLPEGGKKKINQFKRPYNPQILKRERKENPHQRVLPPFHNYLDGEDDEEEGDQDINFVQNHGSDVYLNVEDYKNSSINQFS